MPLQGASELHTIPREPPWDPLGVPGEVPEESGSTFRSMWSQKAPIWVVPQKGINPHLHHIHTTYRPGSLTKPPECEQTSMYTLKHNCRGLWQFSTNAAITMGTHLDITRVNQFGAFAFAVLRRKNEPIRGSRGSRGSPGSRGSGPRTAAPHLPNTRQGSG